VANLTIAVDDDTLKKARIRALEEDTSVNAVLREYLEEYAGRRQEQLEAARRIIEASRESRSGSGPNGRKWKREDAYEERLGPYHTG
jgi:plasmid stability protein